MNYSDLPNWDFKVEEMSANVYRVTATNLNGQVIQKTGFNPEEMLEEVKQDAISIPKSS